MTKILKTLLPATAALVFSTLAHGQDAAPGTESAPEQGLKLSHSQVIRYSAGDSIPLGYAVEAKTMPVQTKVVRYSAGDSIVLGSAQPVQVGSAGAATSAAQAKTSGFSKAAHLPLAGALADSVTTYVGLNQAGIAEKNGLINTSPAGLLGLFVIKAGLVYYFEQQTPEIRKSGLKTTAGVWNGVAMNNILLVAGASNPVSLLGGALFGAYMYHQEALILEKEKPHRTAQRLAVQAR
ncbi:MAG: hypothetical protein ABWY08_11975 [Comamonas sp.]